MNVLMVTNKVTTYALGFQNIIGPLRKLGHEVVWAANFSNYIGDRLSIPCVVEHISIDSNPLNPSNRTALKQVCEIIKKYDIQAIQCSTPIGGLIGRLAGRKMHISPIIYTAHGFLFFKGAPIVNKTVYKIEEMWLAKYTDVLITINDEDYHAAQKLKLRSGGRKYMIHGAGVEIGKRVEVDRKEKRTELGVPQGSFMVVSGGFLNANKNNRVVIEALSLIKDKEICYVACGEGEKLDELKKLAQKLHVETRVLFPGFRTDFAEILASADAFTMPSFREGVPRSLLEAMDLGVPCVGSNTRGIRELIGVNNEGGFLCDPRNAQEFADAIVSLKDHPDIIHKMAQRNKEEAKKYSKEVVYAETIAIYKEVLS